mgnify:CR=1 FL=1
MDFVWAVAFHIKPIDVTVLLMIYILLSFTMGFLPISHTFPIASTMGMVWLSSIPIPRPTTMGMLRILNHPIAIPYYPSLLPLIWDCYGPQSTIPFPYHPSILQLIWDCFRLKTTIPFPYYLSILQLIRKYCYRSQSTISLPYHLLVSAHFFI